MSSCFNVCVVTGARSEYGLLKGVMSKLDASNRYKLQTIVTGLHLSPEFGLTWKVIEEDGFKIDAKVEMLLSGDTRVSVTKSMGLATIGFADSFERLAPDIIILLGDRFEALSAAQAAMIANIPILHIHGGEVTEGAVDESIRHAITKMSHVHFTATEEYRNRVIQLGEQPDTVFTCGAPGLDNIVDCEFLSKTEFEESINFKLFNKSFLITFHPQTVSDVPNIEVMKNIFLALDQFPDTSLIFTFPNADVEGHVLIEQIKSYCGLNSERACCIPSLGQVRYLSALKLVDAVVGNSSSGLIEVPSFKKPTINIGDRQKGRVRASSVIDCDHSVGGIFNAIQKGLSAEFKETLKGTINPYGDGEAADMIVSELDKIDIRSLGRKSFYDVV